MEAESVVTVMLAAKVFESPTENPAGRAVAVPIEAVPVRIAMKYPFAPDGITCGVDAAKLTWWFVTVCWVIGIPPPDELPETMMLPFTSSDGRTSCPFSSVRGVARYTNLAGCSVFIYSGSAAALSAACMKLSMSVDVVTLAILAEGG